MTGPDGAYRFGDLPTGVYRVTFELAGFKTFVRDELRLPIGFVARVDVGDGDRRHRGVGDRQRSSSCRRPDYRRPPA